MQTQAIKTVEMDRWTIKFGIRYEMIYLEIKLSKQSVRTVSTLQQVSRSAQSEDWVVKRRGDVERIEQVTKYPWQATWPHDRITRYVGLSSSSPDFRHYNYCSIPYFGASDGYL